MIVIHTGTATGCEAERSGIEPDFFSAILDYKMGAKHSDTVS